MVGRITNAAVAVALLLLTSSFTTTTEAFISSQKSRVGRSNNFAPKLKKTIHDPKKLSCSSLERWWQQQQKRRRPLQQQMSKNDDIEDDSEGPPPPAANRHQEEEDDEKDLTKETEKLTKNVKKRLLQAELESILNSPDPPFDYEHAISSVQNGISTPLPPDSAEAQTEKQIHDMETALYKSINEKNWEDATKTQKAISKLHVDDCGFVLQTNSLFYKAFSTKDYNAMESLWLQDPSVKCIHPCQTPLVGAKDVLHSWKALFASSNPQFQKNKMVPTNVHLSLKGTTAIVTCDEEIYVKRFVRGKKRKEEVVNKLTATNIYRKMGDKWYMVHHHSSWHADTEIAKNALNYQSGNVGGVVRRKLGSGDDRGELSLDDILGIPQNDLGGSSKSLGGLGGGEEGPQVKRVFMGSLSDLLNGGLSDILSSDDTLGSSSGSSGSSLGDILRSSGSGSSLSSNGGIKPTIIRLNGQINDDSNDDEDDDIYDVDEEDDDEDDEEDDEEDKKEGATRDALKVIKDMSKMSSSSSTTGNNNKVVVLGQQQQEEEEESQSKNNVPKDALRQNCITALRKLCDQGAISHKQKRVLLTDIITCSARGEFSMVEVAFELLCGEEGGGDNGQDTDIGEEEFADQCRVFAMSLPEFPTP